jgi:hypothetical protein
LKEVQIKQAIRPGFQLQMVIASTAILIFDIVGCRLTHILVPQAASIAICLAIVVAAVQAFPAYWHGEGKMDLRDAAATIPWVFILWAIIPFPDDIAARLGMGLNLQDAHSVRLDALLGVSVPGIMSWASHHWPRTLSEQELSPACSLIVALLPSSRPDGQSQTSAAVSDI